MFNTLTATLKCYSFLRTWKQTKKSIVVGLKCDLRSKQLLQELLDIVADSGDEVLAVHVQEPFDSFDPNSFHFHEDLSKSKKVDFQVKICRGDSVVDELCNHVRDNFASILAVGCDVSGPKESVISALLRGLPPTCNLVVVDSAGNIRLQKPGTSQQGSILGPSQPSSTDKNCSARPFSHRPPENPSVLPKPPQVKHLESPEYHRFRTSDEAPDLRVHNSFNTLNLSESKGCFRHFTLEELRLATADFSREMVIGEGGNSTVYRAILTDSNAAAVKVLKTANFREFFRELEILSGVKHKNIVEIIGYCCGEEKPAIVYNLLKGSLSQNLKKLKWSERMGVAVGVAEALHHLHHSLNPPIIHRDVKSSNILLSEDYQPHVCDFGAAIFHRQSEDISMKNIEFDVVGTFGYLAPEYVMYGKIDKMLDVYSYGVVLLELISGKDAIQTNQSNCESLVLWAKSLLSSGSCERLIDPHLNGDYNKDEMEKMMSAASLCLSPSPSRRPTMETILKSLKDGEICMKTRKNRDESSLRDESEEEGHDDLSSTATFSTDNTDAVS